MGKLFAWVRRLYDRVLALAQHPKAAWWLAAISFAESSFFPIPPDVMLLPMCLANRRRAFHLAALCTLASIAGGVFGYTIGALAFESLGRPVLSFYGVMDDFTRLQSWYDLHGGIVVFVAGLTPIPYKVITLSAGGFGFGLWEFVLFSLASRGLRFGLEALILWRFGQPAMRFLDAHFNKLTVVGAILLVGGFILLRWLVPH